MSFTVSYLLAFFSFVAATSEAAPFSAQASSAFVTELGTELAPIVHETVRPLALYHYGKRGIMQRTQGMPDTLAKQAWGTLSMPRLGPGVTDLADPKADLTPVEMNPPEVVDYFKTKAGLVFGAGTADGAAGPGLYAAVDPIQSESYAGDPWFLLEIQMPSHIRYVNFDDGIIISRAFFDKWLKNLDWSVADGNYQTYTILGADRVLVNKDAVFMMPEIRKLWMEALKSLRVDMMSYAWSAYGTHFCKFNNVMGPGAKIAFVFVNPDFADRKDVQFNVFVSALEANPDAAKTANYNRIADIAEMEKIEIFDSFYEQPGATYRPDETFHLTPAKIFSAASTYSKLFFRTQGWNEALGREPRVAAQVFKADGGTQVASWLNDWSVGKEASIKHPDIYLDQTHFSASEKDFPSGSGVTRNYTYRANLDEMVSAIYGAVELNRRQAMLSASTFGCDANHPEENIYEQFLQY